MDDTYNLGYINFAYSLFPGGVERVYHELANCREATYPGKSMMIYAEVLPFKKKSPFKGYAGYGLSSIPIYIDPYFRNGRYKSRYIEPYFNRKAAALIRAKQDLDLVHGMLSSLAYLQPIDKPILPYLINPPSRTEELEVLQRSRKLVSLTQHTADELIAQGFAANKIEVVQMGVDTSRFFPASNPDTPRIRARPFCLIANMLHPKKRNIETIIWFHELIERGLLGADIDLIIYGTGRRADIENLTKLINGLKHRDRIIFDQSRDKKLELYYRDAMVSIINGDRNENDLGIIPLVIFESMAAGCPTLVVNNGSVHEIIAAGTNALLFEPENKKEFQENLIRLCSNDSERAALGAEARNSIEKHDWRNAFRRIEDLGSSIIK